MSFSRLGYFAGILMANKVNSAVLGFTDEGPTESVDDLKPNPEQFGEPTPAQRNANLSGRRGKIPRRKRKALNAKQRS